MGTNKKKPGPNGRDMLANGMALDDFLPYVFNRVINRLNLNLLEVLRPKGITVPRWRVLAVLGARDGRNIGELSAFTVIEQPTLSRIVGQMERDGLVSRRPDPNDNRVVLVSLTKAGRRSFEDILPIALAHMDLAVAGFSGQELRNLQNLLNKVLDNVDESPYR